MEFALDDIRENVMVDVIDLCKYNFKLNAEIEDGKENHYKIENSDLQSSCHKIANLNALDQANFLLTPDLAKEILTLWQCEAMKQTWRTRKNSHIMDNTPYFLNKVNKIAGDDYIVTFDDYVRLRDQTTFSMIFMIYFVVY